MVISIASQKGGTGKTSTSISLAAGLARKGKPPARTNSIGQLPLSRPTSTVARRSLLRNQRFGQYQRGRVDDEWVAVRAEMAAG